MKVTHIYERNAVAWAVMDDGDVYEIYYAKQPRSYCGSFKKDERFSNPLVHRYAEAFRFKLIKQF